jgi:protoheme IX farnesyltransferase
LRPLTRILNFSSVVSELSRPKLSSGIVLSAVTGYLIGRPQPGPGLLLLIPGIFLISAGSSALNQFTERALDALMARTGNRPLPAGKISPGGALLTSIILVLAGVTLLFFTGALPALLGILNLFLYNYLYTGLKRKTPLALLPGGLVGAVPPLIGYSASGNTEALGTILSFALFMFLWQLPHFWLIAIKYDEDYRNAGYKFIRYPVSKRNKKMLVFAWIVITTFFLAVLPPAGLFFNGPMRILLLVFNVMFIFLFYLSLFSEKGELLSKHSFALVNSFGVIVMIFFIINSLISNI